MYDSSKYKLKYYAERTASRTGTQVRIEILEKTDTDISPMEMDALVSASLEIQGAQDKIDTPIVKTSVTITMVDAPDKSSGTVKCGDWSEFYTPDSTLYLVIIKTRENGSWATRWSGYITPDSWEERLEYRGTVSITARDNIGHLQDFQFDAEGDAEGLISIHDLVMACADKVDLPMELLLEDSGKDIAVLEDKSGNPLFDMLINVSLFSGKSWYEALEEVLDSLGMYLRYVDNNRIMVGVLRNMPLLGNSQYDTVPQLECVFTDGSLTIDPAYKSIKETIEYEIGTDESADATSGLTYSETPGTYTFKPEDSADAQTAPAYSLENSSDIGWSSDMPAFLDASKYEIDASVANIAGIEISTCAILAANADPDLSLIQKYSFGKVNSPFVRIEIGFSRSALYLEGSTLKSSAALSVESIKVGARYTTPDGTVYTFEGSSWVTQDMHVRHELSLSGSSNKAQFDISKGAEGPLELQMPAGGELVLYIYSVKFSNEDNTVGPLRTGRYGCITSMSVELATDTIATLPATTVTTVNNESYNVEEEHESTICAANAHVRWFSPSTYPSVLYVRAGGTTSMANYSFRWANGEGDLPLPVVLHMEKLCYHITAFEILEGDVYLKRNGLFAYPSVNSKYTYKGNTYLLMSGSIDLLQGVLTGVALRQYLVYDDVWSDNLPDYDISGGGSSSGGSSSGSGSSGSGSGTSGLGAIKSQLDAHVSNALVHVTTAERELWNLVASLFGLDENGDVKVLGGRGLWSDSFLSSKGCDPEAGGGSGAGIDVDSLWLILGSGSNEQINVSHIPSLSISKITDLQNALDSKLEGITKQMVESVLTGNITSHYHSQYAIADNYYSKTEIDNKLSSALTYKGSVQTYANLPSSGNKKGDTWNVVEPYGDNYAWNGTGWDKLGGTYDFSVYALKADLTPINSNISTLQSYFTNGAAKKVANVLTINHDGGSTSVSAKTYNGSAAVTVNIPTTLPASDVYDWAKAKTKPSYTWEEIDGKPSTFTPSAHTHTKSQITDFPTSWEWSAITGTPSTLAEYGISDGVNSVTANGNLSGSISGHELTIGVKSGYAIPTNTQISLWNKICALFGVDADGNVYVENNKGFYSNSFLSARGSDPDAGSSGSGGINEDDLWDILSTAGTDKIDASHIPSLSSLSGQLTNAQLAFDSIAVAGVTVALGGAVTTKQIADALTSAGYKLTDTTYTLASFGITATAAELNKLDGLATTATELGYVHGVTSNIQTQLNSKPHINNVPSAEAKIGLDSFEDLSKDKSFIGSVLLNTGINNWHHVLSIRHFNGQGDGKNYGIYIRNRFGDKNLYWAAQDYGSWSEEKTILDSGNYSDYTVTKTGGGASGTWPINISGISANSDKLDGHSAEYFRHNYPADWDGVYSGLAVLFNTHATGNTPYSLISGNQATVIQVMPGNTNQFGSQLAIGSWTNRLAWRKRKTNEDGTYGWDSWQLIAAGSLVNARTLWGQSFDGTANVSGKLSGVDGIYSNADNLVIYGQAQISLYSSTFAAGLDQSGWRPYSAYNGQLSLGTAANKWKDLYLAGLANIGSTLTVQGLATFNGGVKTNTITLVNGSKTANISLDADGNIHATAGLYSDGFLSSKGLDSEASYGQATDDEFGLVKTGHAVAAPIGKTSADLAIKLDGEGRMYGTLSASTIGMILNNNGYKPTGSLPEINFASLPTGQSVTLAQLATAGFTEEVIADMQSGKVTHIKATYSTGLTEIWPVQGAGENFFIVGYNSISGGYFDMQEWYEVSRLDRDGQIVAELSER